GEAFESRGPFLDDRREERAAVGKVPVERAPAQAGAPRDEVERGVRAELTEHLRAGRAEQGPVAGCVSPECHEPSLVPSYGHPDFRPSSRLLPASTLQVDVIVRFRRTVREPEGDV